MVGAWIATSILCLVPLVYILGVFYLMIAPENGIYDDKKEVGMILALLGVILVPILFMICGLVIGSLIPAS